MRVAALSGMFQPDVRQLSGKCQTTVRLLFPLFLLKADTFVSRNQKQLSEHETSSMYHCPTHRLHHNYNGTKHLNLHPRPRADRRETTHRVCQRRIAHHRLHLRARHLQQQRRKFRDNSRCARQLPAANLLHRLQDPLPCLPSRKHKRLDIGNRCRDTSRNHSHRHAPRL